MKKMNSIFIAPQKQGGEIATVTMPVPKELILPVHQHIGAPPEIKVELGEVVKKGQILADAESPMCVPLHAPAAGTVKEIYDFVTPMGTRTRAIKLLVEENGEEVEYSAPEIRSKDDFLSFVRSTGAVGLGGAAFPTHIKLSPSKPVDVCIINAAECEPRITADAREIIENTEDVIKGAKLIKAFTGVDKVYIAIENRAKEEIEILKAKVENEEGIFLSILKPTYPQGAEKVLIYNVTGRIVPEGSLPMDVGVIVVNISTVGFIGSSSETGKPLTVKRVTVGGDCLKEHKNIFVPVGTKIHDIAEFFGGYVKEPAEIILGGPMMGTTVYSDEYPVSKNTNAILFISEKLLGKRVESECIRCGRCMKECPFDLKPIALFEAAKEKDIEALEKEHLMLCMECGSCAYVCPASRPLTQSHKLAKAYVRERRAKNGK